MRSLGITAGLCLALTGCVAPEALTKDQVKDKVTVHSGYPGCASCYKVQTFTSPVLARVSSRVSEGSQQGWLNAKAQLVMTNNTPRNFPEYRLQLEMVNNGVFASGVKVQMKDQQGISDTLSPVRGPDDRQCFSNFGSGCSWTQTVTLPVRAVQDALAENRSLNMFVGTNVATRVQSNDGYQPVTKVSNRLLGRNFTISSQALKGFVEGVQLAGATLPSIQIESAKSQAQATEARVQAEMEAVRYRAAAERLVSERPLKQRVGAQICQLQSEWVRVGYVEQVTADKLQIRISDIYRQGMPGMHPGGFREFIVWDGPDAWSLCGEN